MLETGLRRSVDLGRVVENLRGVRAAAPGKFVYAVIKANGYGLGAREIVSAIDGETDGYYVFDLAEAVAAGVRKNVIALDQPWLGYRAADYLDAQVRPVVFSAARASELRAARPVLSIDTGMRRFGCRADEVDGALRAGEIDEVMTHAVRLEQVQRLKEITAGRVLRRHAAATALLGSPEAQLDAVRPGLALYRGALRVTTTVIEARDVGTVFGGVAGYTSFAAPRIGVILSGYSQGLRRGPCQINGEVRKILEVGMQSAYVELRVGEGVGTEVVLLGGEMSEALLAGAWGTGEAEVLVRLGWTLWR